MKTVGFIGLGHMGHPMACRLIKAGYDVHVYDIVEKVREAFSNQGGKVASSISDLAKVADIVITSVQTGAQVNEICLGENGIFNHAKPQLLYIDCSSIDMVASRQLHEEAKAFNIAMLDAPVSGGVSAAQAGTLTIMVGGTEDDFERGRPLLSHLGKKIIHAGAAGHGQAAKICNNLLLGISMIGVSEAFTLAKKLGLDQKKFFDISSNASGQCWSMTSYCPVPGMLENVPSNHDYEPGFMAKMMLKDLRLGQHAAETSGAVIPLGALAAELYDLYVNQGFGEKDFSGIIQFFDGVNQ